MSLFDPGPASPPLEALSAGRRRTARYREMLDRGIHPVTKRPLRAGGTCGECANHVVQTPGNRPFHKCRLNITGGPATDIRVSWPACTAFTRSPHE